MSMWLKPPCYSGCDRSRCTRRAGGSTKCT